MSAKLEKVLYTARTTTVGARTGHGSSDDGSLDVQLSTPGSGKPGTNPEQLFAVGYSACFMGAIGLAGKKLAIRIPEEMAVDAEVSLGKLENDGHFALAVTLKVKLPGLSEKQRDVLLAAAHETCPYSRAISGNIEVKLLSED
ncbi:organic hydroperoxide resistance protein [Cedecea davisae]|uniref:Organic hydroperoxide resistance protein n=1 Tax=Cedecea davisae TaxID=158484 RepID=A0ABS6DKX6_9ENTR|nr:organic hydroperoxide resistance protein [Cedecea davisae]MBU4683355.1 organic hydroperoxide resistance protein [Cedecea davisae]MBU4685105.1 organic hydroperoxide resistance protein [Cedecea davisae]